MKILVVDDEAPLARSTMRLLVSLGHEVAVASGANAAGLALDFLGARGPFDMVFTDYRMPDKTGDTVLTEANRLFPGIACVLSTGGTGEVSVEQVMSQCPAKTVLLQKPFGFSELRLALDQAVQKAKA